MGLKKLLTNLDYRKAENNQGNNQIVNITLGEKITKEIKIN